MYFGRLKELYTKKKYPVMKIKTGMFLELHENVGEGDTKRIQKFKGLVIQVKKPKHPDGTFTIRGTIAGVIVEKIFPLSFTKFEKVLLLDQFSVRQSKINYIRDKIGKKARLKSIITLENKERDLLAEAMAEFKEDDVIQSETENTNSNDVTQDNLETSKDVEVSQESSTGNEDAPVEDVKEDTVEADKKEEANAEQNADSDKKDS